MYCECRIKDHFYCALSAGEFQCTDTLPWNHDQFDAFIVVLNEDMLCDEVTTQIIATLVVMNNDWIETIGPGAEELHDCIDRASVDANRQFGIGDGSPMTAWHEEVSDSEMTEYIVEGGHGAADNKLIIFIGPEEQVERIWGRIKAQGFD